MAQENQTTPPSNIKLTIMILVPVAAILAAGVVVWAVKRPSPIFTSLIFYAWIVAELGALAGGAALGLGARYFPGYLHQAILAGTALRMFVTLAGILFFILILPKAGLKFFLLCTVGLYFVGLISETIIALSVVPRGTGFHAHPESERTERKEV